MKMKKLFIATAIALGTLTVTNAQSLDKETPTKDQKDALQDDYKEVEASSLPQAIKDAVAQDLQGATISKAYANKKGEYKLVVNTADKLSQTLFANAKGQWIKKQ